MRRLFLTSMLLLALGFSSQAAGSLSLSASGGAVFPARGINKLLATGYSALGTCSLNLNDNISIGVRSGFIRHTYSNRAINEAASQMGETGVFAVRGHFQSVPLLIAARFAFDGSVLRPYFGIMGGMYFLHSIIAGTYTAGGITTAIPSSAHTWGEPASCLDAGFLIPLSQRTYLDIGGIYSAFSNPGGNIASTDFHGNTIVKENSVTSLTLQLGVRVDF